MNIQVRISRTKGRRQIYQTYRISYEKGMTVLDGLMFVHRTLDPTLAFRWECRQGICGTCGVMLNGTPVLSCMTQIDKRRSNVIAPLANFPVEKDLIVNLAPILTRYGKVKPYLDKIHMVMLTKTEANKSKPFRKCIECGCCIAGSPTVAKNPSIHLDPMALVKIARYVTDPRDGVNRKALLGSDEITRYSSKELRRLEALCPRGVPIEKAVEILRAKRYV